jgi:hypothetical protein
MAQRCPRSYHGASSHFFHRMYDSSAARSASSTRTASDALLRFKLATIG